MRAQPSIPHRSVPDLESPLAAGYSPDRVQLFAHSGPFLGGNLKKMGFRDQAPQQYRP
jgi:hypothetical protein